MQDQVRCLQSQRHLNATLGAQSFQRVAGQDQYIDGEEKEDGFHLRVVLTECIRNPVSFLRLLVP